MAGGGDLHSEAGTAASPGRGTTSSSGSSKGVKKAISPANECRCKCVCVCQCVCACVQVLVLAYLCLVPGALPRLELKSKQKCFHVWACQQICPFQFTRRPRPPPSLTPSFGLRVGFLCAKAFCLISYKHLNTKKIKTECPKGIIYLRQTGRLSFRVIHICLRNFQKGKPLVKQLTLTDLIKDV